MTNNKEIMTNNNKWPCGCLCCSLKWSLWWNYVNSLTEVDFSVSKFGIQTHFLLNGLWKYLQSLSYSRKPRPRDKNMLL